MRSSGDIYFSPDLLISPDTGNVTGNVALQLNDCIETRLGYPTDVTILSSSLHLTVYSCVYFMF